MTTRSAEATIKGYYYQFDTTILKLLQLENDSDTVIIEGIEDIDVNTATDNIAVQCKYLSKPHYIDSAVREPIALMLLHFVNNPTSTVLKYNLYCHFDNSVPGTEPIIDLQKLKHILSYTEKKVAKNHATDNGITDKQLEEFLKIFTLTFGTEFYQQQNQVLKLLEKTYNCTEFTADFHYYNNALRIIIDKAIKKNVAQRKLSKREFIEAIDKTDKLFNEWYIKLKTKQKYLDSIANELRRLRIKGESRTKTFRIGKEILRADNTELPINAFLESLIQKYYFIGKTFRTTKPLTIVIDMDSAEITILKETLIAAGIYFNDGYEQIFFSSDFFNADPIVNTNRAGDKIIKSSYLIKIISDETYIANKALIKESQIFINFSNDKPNINLGETTQFFDIRYCENLKEVYSILN